MATGAAVDRPADRRAPAPRLARREERRIHLHAERVEHLGEKGARRGGGDDVEDLRGGQALRGERRDVLGADPRRVESHPAREAHHGLLGAVEHAVEPAFGDRDDLGLGEELAERLAVREGARRVAEGERGGEGRELEAAPVHRPPDLGEELAPARHDLGPVAEHLGVVGHVAPRGLLASVHRGGLAVGGVGGDRVDEAHRGPPPQAALRGCSHFGRKLGRVDPGVPVVRDAGAVEQALHPAVAHRLEHVGRAADVRAGDPDLRNRRRAGARLQHGAEPRAHVALLQRDRVDVDAREGDAERARSLRTAQQNSHHSSANITTALAGDRGVDATAASASRGVAAAQRRARASRARRHGAGPAPAQRPCDRQRRGRRIEALPGVERDSASSSSFMSTPIASNSGVER
jgi:hypothetical protein